MRRSLVVVIMVLTFAGMAAAQDLPKLDLFAGYSALALASKDITHVQEALAGKFGPEVNVYGNKFFKKGATFSVAYNINDNWGVEANASYHEGRIMWADGITTGEITNSRLKIMDFALFIGPRYSHELSDSFTLITHVMVGANRFRTKPTLFIGTADETSLLGIPNARDDGLAIKGGAGLDYSIRDNLAIRVFQADFIWADNTIATNPTTYLSLKNVSFSGGVVYRISSIPFFGHLSGD
jgi:hypothetical protein